MKKRLVFSANDLSSAQSAMDAARGAGVRDEDISLVVRSDRSSQVPDDRKIVEGDFYAGAAKGAASGAAVGLVAGLAAVAIPPLGITVAGALGAAVGGGVLGAWSTALTGSAAKDPVSRKFEDEVEAGRVLVVIDGSRDELQRAAGAIKAIGVRQLDFERPTVVS